MFLVLKMYMFLMAWPRVLEIIELTFVQNPLSSYMNFLIVMWTEDDEATLL